MSSLRAIYAIVKAGYLNKIRTYRFLILLGLTIVIGYIFVPAIDANYVTLGWGSSTTFYRGVYNSAWIGSMVAMLTGIFLALIGFYVVNDNVKRDEQTGVGQIIATTPLKNTVYTLGNTLCNFLVLSTMVVIIILTAMGMQLVRGEDLSIHLWNMISPFLILVLPVMFLVAATAVFFESRSFLRGGCGNIIYVIIWIFSLPLSESIDPFGINVIISSMSAAGIVQFPELHENQFILGFSWGFPEGRTLSTFTWQGIQWSSEIILIRLIIIGLAIGISILASIHFTRFDPALESKTITDSDITSVPEISQSEVSPIKEIRLTPLNANARQFHFKNVLFTECWLILKEMNKLPMLGSAGLGIVGSFIVLGLLLPLDLARGILLPIAWFFPILIWSKLGSRESRYQTHQIIFSSANSLTRQFPAVWLAGVFLAMITGSGVALNLILNGEWLGTLAWFVGALFIPSLALCFGVWTGSSKLFEFIYTMLWYIGPINRTEILDFMGSLPSSVESGVWQIYLVFSFILLGLSFIGRKWQIQKG